MIAIEEKKKKEPSNCFARTFSDISIDRPRVVRDFYFDVGGSGLDLVPMYVYIYFS